MASPDSWVSEQDLIAATGATHRNIVRWRQQGLIPRPRRRFLGVGVGTASDYPAVSIEMVRRIGELRPEARDVDVWLWQLWLDGFPIDIGRWLGAKLDALTKVLASIMDQDAVEAALNPIKAERGTALQLVHGRVRNKPARNSLMTWALSVGAGVTPAVRLGDPDPPLFDILKQAAGLSGLWPLPDQDLQVEKLSLSTLRSCLADATAAEMDQARLDWKIISELAEIADAANPALPLIRFLLLLWRDFAVRAMILALLILIRRSPDHARNLSLILTTAHAALDLHPSLLASMQERSRREARDEQR